MGHDISPPENMLRPWSDILSIRTDKHRRDIDEDMKRRVNKMIEIRKPNPTEFQKQADTLKKSI